MFTVSMPPRAAALAALRRPHRRQRRRQTGGQPGGRPGGRPGRQVRHPRKLSDRQCHPKLRMSSFVNTVWFAEAEAKSAIPSGVRRDPRLCPRSDRPAGRPFYPRRRPPRRPPRCRLRAPRPPRHRRGPPRLGQRQTRCAPGTSSSSVAVAATTRPIGTFRTRSGLVQDCGGTRTRCMKCQTASPT